MHKKLEKILRIMIIFWAVYALFESFIYLSNIRLEDVKTIWPAQALAYFKLMGSILGSIFMLISVVALMVQSNLDKYKEYVKISGIWAVFHGGLLIFFSSSSLYVWFPFYNQYLLIEGIALLFYSGIVYLWIKKHV